MRQRTQTVESKFNAFVEAVTRRLRTELEARGFALWQPDIRTEAKCIFFRRKIADETHLFEVYFDKYARLKCGVSIGKFRGDNVLTYWGENLPAEQVTVGHLPNEKCAVRGNSLLIRGSFVPPIHRRICSPSTAAIWTVRNIGERFDVIEDWFKAGKSNPELIPLTTGIPKRQN